jgi:hypothetical protein
MSTRRQSSTVKAAARRTRDWFREILDAQFITPTVGAVANVNPASVTNTATRSRRAAPARRMRTRT